MIERRGFLKLFAGAIVSLANKNIPVVSRVARKVAERSGWLAVRINGQRVYLPFWE